MTSHSPRLRHLPALIGLLLVACLALAALSVRSAWARNRAALALNRALVSGDDLSPVVAGSPGAPATPVSTIADTSFAHRDAGHRALAAGNREAAGRAFAAAGWDAQNLAAMAEHYFQSDRPRAIAWLALASAAGSGEPQITARLGEACRQDWSQDPACQSFLELNGDNRFVNARFAAGMNGWSEIGAPAEFVIVPCPGRPAETCAEISLDEPRGNTAAGLSQCFQVEPGVTYRFSAWLRVATAPDGLWRPLYFQGTIDGQPRGNWQGDERGVSNWRYWERQYTLPAYDDGQACFSPIRLLDGGQAWFYDSKVISLKDGS